jgi:hypothetical protein
MINYGISLLIEVLLETNKSVMKKIIVILIAIGMSSIASAQQHELLGYFEGNIKNNQILLNWSVVKGKTCSGIRIFHSIDNVNYTEIGEIKGICGSVSDEITYNLVDFAPVSNEKNYYKLELGFQGYSTPLILDFQNISDNGYSIFPNPGVEKFQIFISGSGEPTELYIYDLTGRLSGRFDSNSGQLFTVPTNDWKPGVYFVKIVKQGDIVATAKWVKSQ